MRMFAILLLPLSLTLVLASCDEGKSPVVHSCKAYADEASCVADSLCKWKSADPAEADSVSKCKAK